MKNVTRRPGFMLLAGIVAICIGVAGLGFAQGGRESTQATVASAGSDSSSAGTSAGTTTADTNASSQNASGASGSAADTFAWHGLTVYKPNADLTFPITHTDAEWHKMLDSNQYNILREAGTEPPFTGALLNEHRKGIFYSAATGEPLFASDTKFDSHTGWPSFYQPIKQGNVILREDDSLFEQRVEVLDSASGSHLGHVFDDGPAPTGLRYCMDSGALLFVPDGGTPPPIVQKYLAAHGGA